MTRKRLAVFRAMMVAVVLITIELASFALTRLRPDLFDDPEKILRELKPSDFERVKATTASDLLGWDNPASTVLRSTNCVGQEVTQTYGKDRLRLNANGGSPVDAVVLVAGDSYTHGNEVDDDQTYPAQLQGLLGRPVANFGVSGYGPDQALLKLENQIDLFPYAKVVVLSILYDDTARMLNSFRPLLQRPTGRHFGLKPFVENGSFHGIVGGDPYRDFSSFTAAALSALKNDYWRRPRAAFPYALSVARMLILPSLWVPALTQVSEKFGFRHYQLLHRLPSVRRGLQALYDSFLTWTNKRGLKGIVVFIPVDRNDQTSGLTAIAAATEAQRRGLVFHNVAVSDAGSYQQGPGCHPSPTGYGMIAASVAEVVRPFLASP